MTLIEMSVAILVLLMFVGLLMVGARAWMRGSDRAACLLNIRQVQQSIRGYANVNGLRAGDPLVPPDEPQRTIIGPGNFMEKMPSCPGEGFYSFSGAVVPETGVLFMTCSLSETSKHEPEGYESW